RSRSLRRSGRRRWEPEMQRGVRDMRSSIAALADENVRCRPATSTHTGAGEPVEVYGAGVSGAAGLLPREHVGLCPGRGPSGPTPSGEGRLTGAGERHGGHVRPGCRPGCWQGHGDGVRAHARPTRWAAQRDAHVQDDVRLTAGDAGLAYRDWGEDRGDGVDLVVLEAALLLPGRGQGGGG